MKKKPARKATNGSGRSKKKAVGHEGGKRVAAFRHRANVIPSNGDLPTSTEVAPAQVSIGEAMRRAVEELGETVINDELAPSQLRQLADAFEQVTREQAAFNQKSEDAKAAKKALEGATEFLLSLVKEFTHPTPLPLFDQTQAEDDHEDMLDGPEELQADEATT